MSCSNLLDLAENYSFLVQDAIQGFQLKNSQATTHPFVVYKMKDNKITTQSFCIISDSLQYDTNTVHYFLHIILEDLKTNMRQLTGCTYFSHGAAKTIKTFQISANMKKTMVYQQSGTFCLSTLKKFM